MPIADPVDPAGPPQAPLPDAVAAVGGVIWIEPFDTEYRLLRFDPTAEQVTASVRLDYPVTLIAADDGSLWAVGPWGGAPLPPSYTVSRIDLATGRLHAVAEVTAEGAVTVGLGSIWLGTWEHLTRQDPMTGKELGRWDIPADGVQIACGAVWAWDFNGRVSRLDPTLGVIERYDGEGPLYERKGECWSWVEDGIERLWPQPPRTTLTSGSTSIWFDGSTFWRRPGGSMQRWDPATGAGVGPTWTIDRQDINSYWKIGDDGLVLSAGGSVWLVNGFEIVGFDIPAG